MRDAEVRAAFRSVIESLGPAPLPRTPTASSCACSRAATPTAAGAYGISPHRDTWGSNVLAQINLWGPVFPVEPGATMVIWPMLFGRPVPNTSADWDLERLRESPGRYPLLPECRAPLDGTPQVPVLIEPGDLLCFSGAHLHASRANRTGRTRLSIDTRVVDRGDVRAGRGPANVDGHAPRVGWEWFRSVADGGAALAAAGDGWCRFGDDRDATDAEGMT